MNQQMPSTAPSNAPQGWPGQNQKSSWFKRTWVVAIGAGIVGIGLGAASTGTDVKSTPEYEAVASDLLDAEKQVSDTEDELNETRVELAEVAGDVPDREAAVEEAEADLAVRDAKLSKAEAAVTKREKAVGLVEKDIEQNTISGSGVWEVGADIKPGTYKTKGGGDCYYAVLNSTNTSDIANNNNVSGPAIVTVSSGQYLELSSCGDWTLQR